MPTSKRKRPPKATPRGPTAYGYCRISLDRAESVSIADQESKIRAYHAHRLPDLPLVIVRDEGVSGAIPLLQRPGGQRLVDLREGDHVVVAKVDRICRSMADGAALVDDCRRRKIGMHLLDINVETTSAANRAMVHMLMTFAELEREMIGQRRRDAAAYRRKRGDVMHTVETPPMGWRVTGRKGRRRYVPDQADRRRCRELLRLHDREGLGYRKLEQWCGARRMKNRQGRQWTRTTIRRAILAARNNFPTVSDRLKEWGAAVPTAVTHRLRKSQYRRNEIPRRVAIRKRRSRKR